MFIAISGNVVYNSLRLSTANTVHMKMCIKYSTYPEAWNTWRCEKLEIKMISKRV